MPANKSKRNPLLVLLVLLSLISGYLYYTGWWIQTDTQDGIASNSQTIKQIKTLTLNELDTNHYPARVLDTENQIGIYVDKLRMWSEHAEKNLGLDIQFIVTHLTENDIGAQAAKLFSIRRIGQNAKTGGILILIDPRQGKAKIEVSYQLEGVLTDSVAGRIAKTQLAPYVSYKSIGMALMDTMKYIQDYIYLAAMQGQIELDPKFRSTTEYLAKQDLFSGGAGGFAKLSDLSIDRDFKRPLNAKEVDPYRPSSDPLQSAEAVIRVYRDLIGDPNLDLFTAESKIQRRVYPVAPFEYWTHYRALSKSRPFVLVTQGEYAVLTSNNPAYGFFPIMLKKEAGLWRMDLVETWKNMFFNKEAKYYLRNSNMPYSFGMSQYGEPDAYNVAALPVSGTELPGLMQKLTQTNTAQAHFQLAELHFRNSFTALEALKHYEMAVDMAPNYPRYAEILADRYLYLYFPQAAIPILKKQGRVALLKLAQAYAQAGDYQQVETSARAVLESNPYSAYALQWLVWSLDKQGRKSESENYKKQLGTLLQDPEQRSRFVWLSFTPREPVYHTETTVNVGATKVYGHSEFSVTMTNYSNRDVEIKSLVFSSRGDHGVSGLGDIKGYFQYSNKNYILAAKESVVRNKTWGFTIPVKDKNMTYDFELCWQGVGDSNKQCEVQRLNLISKG